MRNWFISWNHPGVTLYFTIHITTDEGGRGGRSSGSPNTSLMSNVFFNFKRFCGYPVLVGRLFDIIPL